MPQTDNAVSQACSRIDISILADCSSWTNISGSSNSITGTTQTKQVGEEFTFDGTGPIVEIGKVNAFDLTVRIVFTNQATEAYRLVRDKFNEGECAGKICLRWIPGGAVGNDGFETNYAPISSFDWPEMDSAAAGPVMASFVLRVSEIDPFVFAS